MNYKMIDPTIDQYQNGKIYKITSPHTDKIYIGSTIQSLHDRFASHKSVFKHKKNYTSSFDILQYGDAIIELIEEYPTTCRELLESREGELITSNNNCVNKYIPGQKIHDINKYQYGKIYKLVSLQTEDIYIGSTSNTLQHRFKNHQTKYLDQNGAYMTSYEILKYDDARIELIEAYMTTSKYLLETKERYWIENFRNENYAVVNKLLPTRTGKERSIINKDINAAKSKEYRETHQDQIKQKNQQYIKTNKEKIKQKQKIYNKNNEEKIKQNKKIYRENNKEKISHTNIQYKKTNKEKIKNQNQVYTKENAVKIAEKKKIYQEKNKEKIIQNIKQNVICDECKLEMRKHSLNRHKKTQHL